VIWPVKIPTIANISDFLTKPVEDIKGSIPHVDKLYSVVNGTFYNTYSEYQVWISSLCNTEKFTKTKDVKNYQDLIKLKQDSKSKVECMLSKFEVMSYYERIRTVLISKFPFTM